MHDYLKITCCFLILTTISACKKSDIGGEATLMAIIKHHDTLIKGATVYLKFGEIKISGDIKSDYDLMIKGSTKENHIHVEGLRYGQYYLYAEGIDSTIMETVSGGVSINIKWSERKQEIEVNVPVTE